MSFCILLELRFIKSGIDTTFCKEFISITPGTLRLVDGSDFMVSATNANFIDLILDACPINTHTALVAGIKMLINLS